MALDTQRHDRIFSSLKFDQRGNRISLIGADALGSSIGRHLAELGVPFDVWDPETVAKDGPFGAFGRQEQGANRAEALRRILERDTGVSVRAHPEPFDGAAENLGSVVFLCSAEPEQREMFAERFLEGALQADVFVDAQAGLDRGAVHFVQPGWRREVRAWQDALERRPLEAGEPVMDATVSYVAGAAVFKMIRWFSMIHGTLEDLPPRRFGLSMRNRRDHREAVQHFAADFRRADLSVTLIGGGALGSRVGRMLGQLGIPFSLFEDDTVEGPNIPNQAYGLEQIGRPKGEALRELLARDFDVEITWIPERFDGRQALGNIVFCCPDNMLARSDVWSSVKFEEGTKVVIEGRMAPLYGKVYTAFPRSPLHLIEYGNTLHSDEQAVDRGAGACAAIDTVGPTAECIAARMVWQLIRWFVSDEGQRRFLDHEIFDYCAPPSLYTRNFRKTRSNRSRSVH